MFWDFGGVILTSPFEAFARWEASRGLPQGFVRTINSTNPDANAWARFERSEVDVDGFCELFEAEALASGHRVDAREVLACLAGDVRPEMVEALRRVRDAGYVTACLTNNVVSMTEGVEPRPDVASVLTLFDHVVESSRVGVRKPDVAFYELACGIAGVAPDEVVFLDDLGVNLKPARVMGMRTIKVDDPASAIAALESELGIPLH